MAEYTVATFSEFLEACADTSWGNAINLPEDAIWDMNELDPYGSITEITVGSKRATIHGNNTVIKNFHGRCLMPNSVDAGWERAIFEGLHFENMLSTDEFAFKMIELHQCKVSVQLGVNVPIFGKATRLLQSSINIDSQHSSLQIIQRKFSSSDYMNQADYCRFSISASNVSGSIFSERNDDVYNSCEFIMNAPNASDLKLTEVHNSTVRGELGSVTTISDFGDGNVICFDDMDSLDIGTIDPSKRNWLVTDEQLRDINDLHSVGFIIGE